MLPRCLPALLNFPAHLAGRISAGLAALALTWVLWAGVASPARGAAGPELPAAGPYHLYLSLLRQNFCRAGLPVYNPPPLPLRINAGGCAYTDPAGRLFYPDNAWSPEQPAGYSGGQVARRPWPTAGDEYPTQPLYDVQRLGWKDYRIGNLPDGEYLVTLHFNEQSVHGPGLAVFSVTLEGRVVLENLDVYAEVGRGYPLVRRFSITVSDGELELAAIPVVGDPHLAALEVSVAAPDKIPPPAPARPTLTSSYAAVLLDWPDLPEPDLDGYYVYRAAQPGGPYQRLNARPLPASRYQDATALPPSSYSYRITASDVYGNEGAASEVQTGRALALSEANLPLLQLQVAAADLQFLYANPFTDDEVPGTVTYKEVSYPVLTRFRGSISRNNPKKSWEIIFTGPTPFPGQSRLNLSANFFDPTLLRAPVAGDLFNRTTLRPPLSAMLLLSLNGRYMGVYQHNEQVDQNFLVRSGRDPGASIYKVENNFARLLRNEEAYRRNYEKKTNKDSGYSDLIAFIELINKTPVDSFPTEIARSLDVPGYLDYYALNILIGNLDFTSHNLYLVHDLNRDRWEVVPWDLDISFFTPDLPIDSGVLSQPALEGATNVLITRLLDTPQYRSYYCRRLAQYNSSFFAPGTFHPLVEGLHGLIAADARRDWLKHGREDNTAFAFGPNLLRYYTIERSQYLAATLPAFCPAEQLYLKINEVLADNKTGLCDPADSDPAACHGDWFEVYNPGLEAVDLQGLYLSDDPSNPTKFRVAQPLSIPALGFALFWADGQPEQGPDHTNFKLDAKGEYLSLYAADGLTLLDSHTFGAQPPDHSTGRYPDGAGQWVTFVTPSPGSSNRFLAPLISAVEHSPAQPGAGQEVQVSAQVQDDGTLAAVTLYYRVNGGAFSSLAMTPAGEDRYQAALPGQPKDTLVQYYLFAQDNDGQVSLNPPAAPSQIYEYVTAYQALPLFINELMAENRTTLCDPDDLDPAGCFDDWFEIYNAGDQPIDLQGLYLTDDLSAPNRFLIAGPLVVPAHGFVLIWADGETAQGVNHTNFKLSKDGESLAIVERNGVTVIDSYTFPGQASDISTGRCPDGSGTWHSFSNPTPGASNGICIN